MTIDQVQQLTNEVANAYKIPPPEVVAFKPRPDPKGEIRVSTPVLLSTNNRLRVLPEAFDVLTMEEMRYGIALELAGSRGKIAGLGCGFAVLSLGTSLAIAANVLSLPMGRVAGVIAAIGLATVGIVVGLILLAGIVSLGSRAAVARALKLTGDADAALSYTEKRSSQFGEGSGSRFVMESRLNEVRRIAIRLGIA